MTTANTPWRLGVHGEGSCEHVESEVLAALHAGGLATALVGLDGRVVEVWRGNSSKTVRTGLTLALLTSVQLALLIIAGILTFGRRGGR
ncbi:hypothetical protein [Luteitalea sp.]|uniref:hypothetical protein n=1 Tax=Luteitalea sp. TaxID=2004800 RepID=UPI0025BF7C1F|nr:hypothetical protein [Luteitalea sp.]